MAIGGAAHAQSSSSGGSRAVTSKGGPKNYKALKAGGEGTTKEGNVLLQSLFRVLESRGPKESTNLLRDIMESMKLVQAITGTGAAASFVHANSYSDTRGEAFGFLTALSTVLSLMSLIVTVTIYVSLGLLEHEDMNAVEGYLVRYWVSISCTIVGSIASMMLLVTAVVLDAFHTYSTASAIGLLVTTVVGLLGTAVFTVHSVTYVFTTGAESKTRKDTAELDPGQRPQIAGSPLSDQATPGYAWPTEGTVWPREGTVWPAESSMVDGEILHRGFSDGLAIGAMGFR